MNHRLIPFIILLFVHTLSLHAQIDTRGRDFWLTFGRNINASSTAVDLQIRIVSGAQPVTGSIDFTELGTSVPFSVSAYQVYTYSLNNAEKQAVYNTTMGINSRSVHITASAPVSAYALNQYEYTTDATTIFPVTALGTNYYYISYTPHDIYNDAYAIVATQNNTQVYHNGILAAILNTGQVYYRTSRSDMTGAHITSDKPVALFAMNQGVEIPSGAEAVDNLFHQLAPVPTWGKTFFVPVSSRGQDIVRIIASENNTVISQTGGLILRGRYNLDAGEFLELTIPLFYNGCYIQTNKPVGVCTYLTGSAYNGGGGSDPAQAWLPPIDQMADTALIAPFIPTGTTALHAHYALVITPTFTKENTKIKIGTEAEQPLSGGVWYDNVNAGISFYTMGLVRSNTSSTYLYTNPAGLILMAYGIGSYESYYYLASSLMQDLTVALYVNDIHYMDLAHEIICTQTPVQFQIKIDGNISTNKDHIKWYINDIEETDARDRFSWEKSFMTAGTYRIKVEVLAANNKTIRMAETSITVAGGLLDQPEDITLCAGETISDISFSGIDIDTITWKITSGSEILIGMNENSGTGTLSGFTAKNTTIDSLSVTITVIPKSSGGCEGEPKTFTITVYPQLPLNVNLGNDTTICNLDNLLLDAYHVNATSYQWQDGTILPVCIAEQTKIYSVTVSNTCISVSDEIEITVKDCNTLEIWFPNAFTPNGDGVNDIFKPEVQNPELLKEYEMTIYNRWGNLIFTTQNYQTGWNGKNHKNRDCSEGVYIGVIKYKDNRGRDLIKHIMVTLIR